VLTGQLLHGGTAARHDGATTRERLGDGDPETFVERRIDEAACAAIKRCQLIVVDIAQPDDVRRRLDSAPPARADDTQLTVDSLCDAREVLARLECPDREHIVAVCPATVRDKDLFHRVRHDPNLLRRDVQQRHDLVLRELRDGDHPRCGAKHARDGEPRIRCGPAVEPFRVPQDGDVVDGDHERPSCTERSAKRRTVQEVRVPRRMQPRIPEEVGGQRAQPRGRRERHLDRVQMLTQRADIARGAGTGLVQRRRVERYANRAYPSRKISPTRRHEKRRTCSSPAAESSSRRAIASRMAAAIACGLSGSAPHGGRSRSLVHRGMRRRDDRRAGGHRLCDRHPETLEARGIDNHLGTAVEPRQVVVTDATEPNDPGAVELGLLAPPASSGHDERETGPLEQRKGVDERAQILPGLERCHRQEKRAADLRDLAVGRELWRDPGLATSTRSRG